jgi:hypothetical protein
MKSILWALVGLNVLLLVVFIARATGNNEAQAQAGRPGDYMLIPAEVTGGTSGVVYILDMSNGLLGAMVYDESRKDIGTMQTIDLSRVFRRR